MAERFQSHIKSLTFKGLGVTHHPNGQVFFVKGVWPGDEGYFEVEMVEKRYGYAKLIELTKKSEFRRDPLCPHLGFELGKCGGCPWMIADYKSQLEQKNHLVEHLLDRASVLTDKTKIFPIIGSPKEYFYRNRAQFKTDGNVIGYVSSQSNELAPINDCVVLTDKNRETLKSLRSQLPNNDWKNPHLPQPGNENGTTNKKEKWNFIEIDEELNAVTLNQRRSFKQANNDQNENMKNWLRNIIASFDCKEEVLELFCGSGNFTEILNQKGFSKIVAVESSQVAIDTLKSKNFLNTLPFAENIYNPFIWTKIRDVIREPKILFLDPPREGFSDINKFIKKFPSIEHIIYVSCDLSSFINDVKKLRGLAYELIEVQPIDQFPQTPHIEVLSYLTKF